MYNHSDLLDFCHMARTFTLRSSFKLSEERAFICSTCKGTLKTYNNVCDKISELFSQIVSKINNL